MLLRDLFKTNSHNDGSRSLLESILSNEVSQAIIDWKNFANKHGVLIGGLALSYYVKPRFTSDGDFLYLASLDIPTEVEKFKRTRPGAFLHKATHVEIEVLTPKSINMSDELARKIVETAIERDGFKIASRAGLIAAKLGRFKLQDRADISGLLQLGSVDLSDFPLTTTQQQNLEIALSETES